MTRRQKLDCRNIAYTRKQLKGEYLFGLQSPLPITIQDVDYVLPVAVSASQSSIPACTISSGYDELLEQYVDNRNEAHCLSAAVLRKPGVSGSYTETTWTLSNTSTTDASATAIIKLSPL